MSRRGYFPRAGIPDSTSRVNNAHDRLLEEAKKGGIELGFVLYDLRHTFAARMAEEGIDRWNFPPMRLASTRGNKIATWKNC